MYKQLSCAAFKIKLTTGSGNVDRCEKLHDRSRIRFRQEAGACASALTLTVYPDSLTLTGYQMVQNSRAMQIVQH